MAAARKSSGDRTQLIIGAIAVVIIAIIVVVGVVLYKKNTAVQGSGYGVSKASTASVDDHGIITVSNGSPTLVLDVYEDALCPSCGEFEAQFGQQMAKAIDDGQLTVKYHMVNFLDGSSASKNYSTRAYGALLTVAKGGLPVYPLKTGLNPEGALDVWQGFGGTALLEPQHTHEVQGGIGILICVECLQIKGLRIGKASRLMKRQRVFDPLHRNATCHFS